METESREKRLTVGLEKLGHWAGAGSGRAFEFLRNLRFIVGAVGNSTGF